jgi:purine nucleosidase
MWQAEIKPVVPSPTNLNADWAMTSVDQVPSVPVPMVIDTDGGVDDAVALFFAATAVDIDLVAVTVVHGNVDVEMAAANVCKVLWAAGRRDIPVLIGERAPLGPVPSLRPADFIHGQDGLGNTYRPRAPYEANSGSVAELWEQLLTQRPDQIVLVTLGPLSNVAAALRVAPQLAKGFARLVVMGGAVTTHGNALPLAEANIAHDPVAAQEVVQAGWRAPSLLVGLDVTHVATLTETEMDLFGQHRTEAAKFLDEPLRFYGASAGTFCPAGEFPCHDFLAVLAAARPVVSGPLVPLAVQTAPGPAWGATVADFRQAHFELAGASSVQGSLPGFATWEVGLQVDVAAFRSALHDLAAG